MLANKNVFSASYDEIKYARKNIFKHKKNFVIKN